ncbi:protein ROOT INITIATION DEFECTIVE 3-like [Rhododendron vialii]|uniref:protein ROOT INITIATION DEFECTIVE 3-like n=1 Tax=Rhododendron vialii TaxID=182163 RepID=UPI00265EB24D|nr:protein ROOT INITIATION DEFECTIVE 3-like [Rhododendron vialii]
MAGGGGKEALAVCSNKSLGIGITMWDIESGDHLLHLPTCASLPHGLTCLGNQCLAASQIHRQGSVAGGVIFIWPFNKSQATIRSYPIEAIGPLASTKDGLYLVGGAPSGNGYVWEVSCGRLLRTWCVHHKSLTCLSFSGDDSFLISGSVDGTIVVWPMIGLLDEADCWNSPSLLNFSSEHSASVTSILTTLSSSSSFFVSSSLDGTCKVWDLVTGKLLQNLAFPLPITASVLDPAENMLFSGSADGRIFMSMLDVGLVEDSSIVSEDEPFVLKGHNGSITALVFCGAGLISASEDCTACLWDVVNCAIVRIFCHRRGPITNLVVIPQSSLLPRMNHHRATNRVQVSMLDKYPKPVDSSKGVLTFLPSHSSERDHSIASEFQNTNLLKQQILDLENGGTPAAIQMMVETSIESQAWAARMTKHVMEMNKHLQSRLLDMMQCRLLQDPPDASSSAAIRKRKKTNFESLSLRGEEQSQPESQGS